MKNCRNLFQGIVLILLTVLVVNYVSVHRELIQNSTETMVENDVMVEKTSSSVAEETVIKEAKDQTADDSIEKKEPEKEETEMEELAETEQLEEEQEDYGPVTPIEPYQIMYVQDTVNVRVGPGTKYEKLDTLQTNYILAVDGKTEDGWYRFVHNGKVAFLTGKLIGEEKVDIEAREAERAAAAAAAAEAEAQRLQEAQNEQAQNPAPAQNQAAPPIPAPTPAKAAGVIMVGDSRCVQMREVTGGGGVSWVCENGKGYKWLTETAIGKIDPLVGKGTKVVFCLGVNDPGNVNNYASFANQKAAEWAGRGAKTYYVSCNPVWENPYTTKEQVANFNATLPGALSGVTYIDTYSTLMQNGCKIVDGLHYDNDTNLNIFNMIIGSL